MQVLFDPTVTPLTLQKGERTAVHSGCNAYFTFNRKEEGVVCSNEMEFTVDCPVCGDSFQVK